MYEDTANFLARAGQAIGAREGAPGDVLAIVGRDVVNAHAPGEAIGGPHGALGVEELKLFRPGERVACRANECQRANEREREEETGEDAHALVESEFRSVWTSCTCGYNTVQGR